MALFSSHIALSAHEIYYEVRLACENMTDVGTWNDELNFANVKSGIVNLSVAGDLRESDGRPPSYFQAPFLPQDPG